MSENQHLTIYWVSPHYLLALSHFRLMVLLFRNRGLVQYFSPYISADLRKMSVSFNTSLANLENELMKLILEGSIQV
jgi:COP9 signalosome complex subunit 1